MGAGFWKRKFLDPILVAEMGPADHYLSSRDEAWPSPVSIFATGRAHCTPQQQHHAPGGQPVG